MEFMGWIRFGVGGHRAMMSVIVLCLVSGSLKGAMAARMSAREIYQHGRDWSRRKMNCGESDLDTSKGYKQTRKTHDFKDFESHAWPNKMCQHQANTSSPTK